MKKFIENILGSLNNKKDVGYSAKKLTIFTIIVCVVVGHWKLFNSENWNQLFVSVLTIDYATVLTLFGINVADKSINKSTNEG